MKKLIFICIIFAFGNCKKSTTLPKSLSSFDYMIGNWQRSNEKDSLATFENWLKVQDTLIVGHAYTIKGVDTIWQEFTKIKYLSNDLVYQVKDESQSIINFMITSFTDTSFVSENPQNEFPKKISYMKKGNKLSAIISGGGPEIPFEFEKR